VDLAEAVEIVRADPSLASKGEAAMYGMMAKIPIRGAVRMGVAKVMEEMYAPGGGVPDLGNLGKGEGDAGLFGLLERYGARAMELMDSVDRVKERVRGAVGRPGRS
jgi:hypothetical protein